MPGVDFAAVRSSISMAQVLGWLDFHPHRRSGDQWRGPCPVHGSRSPDSTSFSVNLASHRYQCFRCGSFGNQVELWAAVHGLTVYQAAVELCQRANLPIPWITRW
jgi:DNA primase